MSRRGKVATALAAASLLFAVGLAAVTSAQTTGPKMVTGTGSCTTDANGVCAIAHTLGVVPDAVVVSANTPGQFNAYIVNTVPSTKFDVTGSCCKGLPLSTWPNQVDGRFAGAVSGYGAGSSYNVAWDLWLNGVASGNYTELMIWTQHGGNAAPAGTRRADWTAPNGQVYEVWWDGNTFEKAGGSYLAFISKTTQLSGTVDIRAFIAESAARGYINAVPTLNQLNYGVEVRDTGAATQSNPARFTLTDFALTMK